MNITVVLLSLLVITTSAWSKDAAHEPKPVTQPDYWVEEIKAAYLDRNEKRQQFSTPQGEIPAGCFATMMQQLNGDDMIASVYVGRTTSRGCMDANYPYQNAMGARDPRYSIKEFLGYDTWKLKVCVQYERLASCENLVVRFNKREYYQGTLQFPVLSVDKLGQW